jgi:hypothetical protein
LEGLYAPGHLGLIPVGCAQAGGFAITLDGHYLRGTNGLVIAI